MYVHSSFTSRVQRFIPLVSERSVTVIYPYIFRFQTFSYAVEYTCRVRKDVQNGSYSSLKLATRCGTTWRKIRPKRLGPRGCLRPPQSRASNDGRWARIPPHYSQTSESINSCDHQKSAEIMKLDGVPENKASNGYLAVQSRTKSNRMFHAVSHLLAIFHPKKFYNISQILQLLMLYVVCFTVALDHKISC